MVNEMFNGLSEDAYRYFWEIGFNNNRTYYLSTKDHYRAVVYEPLCRLTDALASAVSEIDNRLSTRYTHVISRIRRDTRFSKDKALYRDHAWLAFRLPGVRTSECYVLYVEFERESYGYGMGMYAPNPTLMQPMRERILAQPQRFLSLVSEPAFSEKFTAQGEMYARARYKEAPEAVQPFLNRRSLSFCFSSSDLKRTMCPEITDEILESFICLKPVYRFLTGLD